MYVDLDLPNEKANETNSYLMLPLTSKPTFAKTYGIFCSVGIPPNSMLADCCQVNSFAANNG